MFFKKVCIRIFNVMKFVYSEPLFVFKLIKIIYSRDNRIILLGTPIHGNYGDHLIAESEKHWAENYFREYTLIECTMPFSKYFFNLITSNVRDSDIVMVSGGGWLGSDWPENELFVRSIIRSLSDNNIVILPQTVHYSKKDSFMNEGIKIYSESKKLIFCLRDRESFNFVINNSFCTKERTLLIPDFGLFYQNAKRKCRYESKTVNICFRDDIEASMSKSIQNSIVKYLTTNSYNLKKVSTNMVNKTIPIRAREASLDYKLNEISECKLLITDRLHAMIMAALTGTPCIAFDNSTHKVKGVHNWLSDYKSVIICNEDEFSIELLKRMLEINDQNCIDPMAFEPFFRMLAQIIKNKSEVK